MLAADIVIGDTHIGSSSGLAYTPDLEKPNIWQKWIFKVYANHFLPDIEKYIDEVQKRYGAIDHIHLANGGDMGDLDTKKRSSANEYWAVNEKQVTANAKKLFDPLWKMCDSAHFIRGTRSHVGTGGGVDEAIADDCDITIPKDRHNKSWYDWEYKLAGVHVQMQHYGKNKSKWGDESLLSALRSEVILDRASNNELIPDICYRFHFHYPMQTDPDKYPRMIGNAAWQLPYEYIYERDPVGRTNLIGGYICVFRDGEILEVKRLTYKYPKAKPKNVR